MLEVNKVRGLRDMSAAIQTAEQPAQPPVEYRGRFKKGYDPRRHTFTKEECRRDFGRQWKALSPDTLTRL